VLTGSRVHFSASQAATNSLDASNDYHDYLRRSLLSASTLGVLQVLEQLCKDEHLQFVSHLLAKEDYAIDHATETAIHELIHLFGERGGVVGLCLTIWTKIESRTLRILYKQHETFPLRLIRS
jgi:hypothetical protein